MRGVTITDRTEDNFLAINLVDILHQIGSSIEETEWEISALECFGTAADKLHQIADRKARVPGKILWQLAENLTQVIEGVFIGYRNDHLNPWIVIEAVDSSAYDVQSDSEDVLKRMRQHFKQVADLPSEEIAISR